MTTPVAAEAADRDAPDGAAAVCSPPNPVVCILSRKDLRNMTRVPRMGKALCDAGCRVVVVALRAPVRELQELCPAVEYIEVTPEPFTTTLLNLLHGRALAQTRRHHRRLRAEVRALANGGWRAGAVQIRRVLRAPFVWAARSTRRFVLAAPAAALLRKPEQPFAAAWRELARQRLPAIVAALVRALHHQQTIRAFAIAADRATRDQRFDVVQAHDNYALPAARRVASRDGARFIYDAVELTEHRLATSFAPLERLLEWRERRREAAIFRKADAVTTVGSGVGEWYVRQYRIPHPLVVRNCRYYWPYEPDGRLRADIGIGAATPLVVWFGGIYPQQGVETLIDAMGLLSPQTHLAVIAYVLPRWGRYFERDLPQRAADRGVADRVHFLPPRDPEDLVPYVSGADLGVIPRPSWHLNNFHSMPNKFLEMIMARLPIAVSRLGDIVDVVERYRIGQSFDERDLADVASVISRMLDPEVNRRCKSNVMMAATEMTWEKEAEPYVALVQSLAPASAAQASARRRPVGTIAGEPVRGQLSLTAADGPADIASPSGAAMHSRNGTN